MTAADPTTPADPVTAADALESAGRARRQGWARPASAAAAAGVALLLAPVPWQQAHHRLSVVAQQPAVSAPVIDTRDGTATVTYGGQRLLVRGLSPVPAPGQLVDVVPDPGTARAYPATIGDPSPVWPAAALLGGWSAAAALGTAAWRSRPRAGHARSRPDS